MSVKPIADRVVLKRIEEEEVMRGGIYIPDTAKEKPMEATVVAVGPGKVNEDGTRSKPEIKKGDRVLIGKYSGSEVTLNGKEHVIIREDDILAVIE